MICSICKRTDVRPPACCDKCGRLACSECMKRFSEPGPYIVNQEDYKIQFDLKKSTTKFILREICKVCQAERTLTEEAHGGAVPG